MGERTGAGQDVTRRCWSGRGILPGQGPEYAGEYASEYAAVGWEPGVASLGGEGIVASEVAALVKDATDLVALVGEVAEVRGPGAAAKALCRFRADKGHSVVVGQLLARVSGIVSVAVSGPTALDSRSSPRK
ncbi:MAG: hypothetical protein OXF41_08020 [bacterium]|nr:hypothetical protein [Acidimicrobiia bacterium]MCY4369359.1 hypothetical protein [bacterium]